MSEKGVDRGELMEVIGAGDGNATLFLGRNGLCQHWAKSWEHTFVQSCCDSLLPNTWLLPVLKPLCLLGSLLYTGYNPYI
jgi:hypothetical protein